MTNELNKKILFKFLFLTVEKWLERDVLSIDFKLFWIRFSKGNVTALGRITDNKAWELDIFNGGDKFGLTSELNRNDIHSIYFFEFQLPKLFDFQFSIYNKIEKDVPDRRKKKAKWYLNTQYLKIYNLDFLNNPYGLTFDFAWFPLLWYTKLSYGVDKWNWALFNFEIKKDRNDAFKFSVKFCLFCLFIEFTTGQNTVVRDANTYYLKDFRTLEMFGADLEHQGKYENIITIQIMNKNLPYLYGILEWCHFDFNKVDTDEILEYAADEGFYNKEIFELITKHINYIRNWNEGIEDYKPDLEAEAYEKLLELKNNPLPQEKITKDEPKEEKHAIEFNKYEQGFSVKSKFFKFSIFKRLGIDWDILFGQFSKLPNLRINWRKVHDFDYESNFQFSLTRDFWIRNYLLTQFKDWKQFSVKISHNNVYPFSINSDIFGIWQDFNIGASTEDPFYNYKKQRLYTEEEHILQNCLHKEIDTDVLNKRRKKYKEFYNSKFVKIYNNNYLRSPYGGTVEFTLPFNLYLKISFNKQDYYEFKNETNAEFTFNFDKGDCRCNKNRYVKFNLSAFKHYFKIVLGKNTITRFSILHSDKSLGRIDVKNLDENTLNRLFKEEIEPHEVWIYKKVIDKGIDLSKLDWSDLIYDLAFEPDYHKATLDYILHTAKENNVRFYIDDDYKDCSNEEIINQLKEWSSDFDEPVLMQLIEYVENQKEVNRYDN